MSARAIKVVSLVVVALVACGSTTSSAPPVAPVSDAGPEDAFVDPGPQPIDASADAPEAGLTAAALLAKVASCTKISATPYATDQGGTAKIDVCGAKNAVFWAADMDIDCDGKPSAQCSLQTDPAFQAQTAAVDSKGDPLDAAALPYVVVPGPSSRWSYTASGLELGSVVAVIYQGKIEYGVIGDTGPSAIIGEASYAMASSLGIDPNPRTGGIGSGVTYIAFTGKTGVVTKNEDHAEAVRVGAARAAQFLAEN